jgi:hypothetical protein
MNEDQLIKKRIKLIQRAFPYFSLDRDGINIAINCVNKSCSTYSRKDKKKLCLRVDNEFYHCWVCGTRGKGLSRFFRYNAPKFYTEASQIFQKTIKEKDEIPDEILELPEGFRLLSTLDNGADPDLKACKKYIESRLLSESRTWYFKVGAVSSGRYRRRIIIPSFDDSGNLNYYTARSIDDFKMKYMNPKVKRADIIFNEINIDWGEELTLVEGPFDLFRCNQNATCLLGSTLSEKHELFRKIVINSTPVVLALDNDANKKTQNIARLLASYDIPVRVLDTSLFEDVGEMSISDFKAALITAQSWSRNDRLKSLISTIKSGSLL